MQITVTLKQRRYVELRLSLILLIIFRNSAIDAQFFQGPFLKSEIYKLNSRWVMKVTCSQIKNQTKNSFVFGEFSGSIEKGAQAWIVVTVFPFLISVTLGSILLVLFLSIEDNNGIFVR